MEKKQLKLQSSIKRLSYCITDRKTGKLISTTIARSRWGANTYLTEVLGKTLKECKVVELHLPDNLVMLGNYDT